MSGDIMDFEDDWREFLRAYSFTDSEEIYTNGSDLISVFRVEQMVEHYFERTCHETNPKAPYFKCDACGMDDMGRTELWISDGFYRSQKPNYCPNCGARVTGQSANRLNLTSFSVGKVVE